MILQQTLQNGTKIWKPNKLVTDGGKRIIIEGLTPLMPVRIETIRGEEMLRMRYSSTTGLKTIIVKETSTPFDVISIVNGEVWLVTKDLISGIVTKTKIDSDEPKIAVIPLNRCSYGIYAISSGTVVSIKKNYRRAVTAIQPLSL